MISHVELPLVVTTARVPGASLHEVGDVGGLDVETKACCSSVTAVHWRSALFTCSGSAYNPVQGGPCQRIGWTLTIP